MSVEHLFLALIEVGRPEAMKKLFKSFGLDRAKVMKALKEVRGSQRVTTDNPEATYQALEKYGVDLVDRGAGRGSSTRSSAATTRSAARSGSFPGRRRTTPC